MFLMISLEGDGFFYEFVDVDGGEEDKYIGIFCQDYILDFFCIVNK